MAQVRAFVAVHLDADTRAALATAVDALRRDAEIPVSWVAPDNFHITLKFLGGVDEGRIPDVIEALRGAAREHAPLDMDVAGLGAFPSAVRPRVLWAGVTAGQAPLGALAASVDAALAALGFPREDRAFSPHVTLGRVRQPRRAPALARALSANATRPFGRVAVREVALMQSHLASPGARYTALAVIPL